MYMIREVMNCKPGKVGELKKKFKALGTVMERMGFTPFRLMTDVCGEPFWTLVAETEIASLNDFVEMEARVMADGEAQTSMAGYHELVVSGRREIYQVVP
jgi:hypothetical protein